MLGMRATISTVERDVPKIIREIVQAHGYEKVHQVACTVLGFPALWITTNAERDKVARQLK